MSNVDQGLKTAESGAGSTRFRHKKTVDLVMDLQFGSTGKGLICGYLANEFGYDTAVTANMPNAGHTYIDKDGNKTVFKVLPSAALSPSVNTVMIGPGAVFDLSRLRVEVRKLQPHQRLVIHPNSMVLSSHHAAEEIKNLNHISSTMQGSAAAKIEKIWRKDRKHMASQALYGTEFQRNVTTVTGWLQYLVAGDRVLAEGAQGYSLGINTQFYPFTTSRDCTPASHLSEMGIPIGMLRDVLGTLRTYPIRVGNTPGGNSGQVYPDQDEITWGSIGLKAEKTTVTGRNRRLFTFSQMQLVEAVLQCEPNGLFLNFANYMGENQLNELMDSVQQYAPIRWVGFGPGHNDIQRGPRWIA